MLPDASRIGTRLFLLVFAADVAVKKNITSISKHSDYCITGWLGYLVFSISALTFYKCKNENRHIEKSLTATSRITRRKAGAAFGLRQLRMLIGLDGKKANANLGVP